MKPVPEDTTQVVRQGFERACRDFSQRIAPTGFVRTKKVFWTRRHALHVELIHFHRHGISYGRPINYSVDIRVHFGIRVLNDIFVAAALNGPYSDPGRLRAGLYHLRFNAKTGSTYDRCVDDLVRFVLEEGEPWFLRFQQPEALLNFQDSPLQQPAKDRLRAAMDGNANPAAEAESLRLLGIKTR